MVAAVGCGNTDSWVEHTAPKGWPAEYANAANSSYSAVPGARSLELKWTRSVKGSLFTQAALGETGYAALNAQTPAGCSLMVWEYDNNGRQRWCNRLMQGGDFAGALFDAFDNVYVGEPGTMLSFPPTQWVRWRQPVIGMPLTPRFVGDGRLLVITHLGQVQILDAQNGRVVGPPVDLIGGVDPKDSRRGIEDCAPARALCPIAAAPAFSPDTGLIALNLWVPGAPAPVVSALKYNREKVTVTPMWQSDAVEGGPLGSPVLSADGNTIYVNGRNGRLWALYTGNGKPKWSVDLGYPPQGPPSVTPGGSIISGGGPDAKLVAVRDFGERGEVVWRRDDLSALTTSSLAGADVGYTVTRADENKMTLVVFDPSDGHTINSYPLPDATGRPVGISVAADRTVVVPTSDGQVYGFKPG